MYMYTYSHTTINKPTHIAYFRNGVVNVNNTYLHHTTPHRTTTTTTTTSLHTCNNQHFNVLLVRAV